MSRKRLLLIVGGGIAAYKSLDLIRRLSERDIAVRAILTRAGAAFVTPLSLATLTGDKVHQDLFSLTDDAEMGHIELSRDADLLAVAPATADLLAKMAGGHADDLASTTLLATDKKVLVAPAMNLRMWQHPATRRNLATLKADGIAVVGPNEGAMACGEFGPGRMAEPLQIAAVALDLLGQGDGGPLAGVTALVTSGPTYEPIDPVRYIANRSSGKQGHAIAGALARLGATVTLVSGPVAEPDPLGVVTTHVETAREMLVAVEAALPAEVAVLAAAVTDWRVDQVATSKIKKIGGAPPELPLVETPDILATLAHRTRGRPRLVIGFAAETDDVLVNATAKRLRKGCDWIVANDVTPGPDESVMGGADNTVHIVNAEGVASWPRMPKEDVAARLARCIADALKN